MLFCCVLILFKITFFEKFFQKYSKNCVKRPLSKRQKHGFLDQLSLNARQKYCRMLQGEHSAIHLTFIKLPIFCLSLHLFLCFVYIISKGSVESGPEPLLLNDAILPKSCVLDHMVQFSSCMAKNIRAVTCDFQQCGILTSVDSDEPVQHPLKLRNSK